MSTGIRTGGIRRAICLAAALIFLSALPISAASALEETGTLTARVVLRKSPDKESKALQTLPEGEDILIVNVSGSWYKVKYGQYTGYLMKKYVKLDKGSQLAKENQIADIGAAPGPLKIGDKGADVKKLQKALKILGYYSGGIDGDYGNLTTAAVTAYQKYKKLTSDGIAGKDTIKAIFGSVAKTTDVSAGSPSAAAKASAAVTSGSSGASGGMNGINSIADIGSAPGACKPGDSGESVKKLQQALTLLGYYSGSIDGDYGQYTTNAVKRFQKKRGMTQDGIAGSSTMRVLFGTSAKKTTATAKTYKTEVLSWFSDNVSSVIPNNAHFTIKDVKTGKTFQAARWSGVNHLDAEPRTKDDTAIMKSIFGGAWSWNRRAILILYNGHVYAASMNGMPHGTTTINNGFDGHFCIHFKNSKTHETNKVDADHQSAVASASKASW